MTGKFLALALIVAALSTGCNQDEKLEFPIIGSWKGLSENTGKTATIKFTADNKYEFDTSKAIESGTFSQGRPYVFLTPARGTGYYCTYSVPVETNLLMSCPGDKFGFDKVPATTE